MIRDAFLQPTSTSVTHLELDDICKDEELKDKVGGCNEGEA